MLAEEMRASLNGARQEGGLTELIKAQMAQQEMAMKQEEMNVNTGKMAEAQAKLEMLAQQSEAKIARDTRRHGQDCA